MSVQPAYWYPANRVVTDASGHVIVAGAESLEHARQALELNPATIGRYYVVGAAPYSPAPAPVVTPRLSREARARAIATVAAELQAAAADLERAVAALELELRDLEETPAQRPLSDDEHAAYCAGFHAAREAEPIASRRVTIEDEQAAERRRRAEASS